MQLKINKVNVNKLKSQSKKLIKVIFLLKQVNLRVYFGMKPSLQTTKEG